MAAKKKTTPAATAAKSSKVQKKSGSGGEKRKPAPPEEEPVLSGRMILALAIVLAMLIVPLQKGLRDAITKTSPQTAQRAEWKVGSIANLHLTVVTSDYDHLACVDSRTVGEFHCEYRDERERWSKEPAAPVDDNRAKTLQPYRTTDKNLLFVPGLWAQPEVAMRLHDEPPHGVAKGKLARFVVACDVKFIEEWQNAMLRWNPSERWSNQGTAMVGEIISCKILEDEKS